MLNHLPHPARSNGVGGFAAIASAMALLAAFAASAANAASATDRAATQEAAGLSRAEVVADLALWRRAGLDRHEVLASSYGLETATYRAAYQEYQRLRSSEQFQIEVRKALIKN